MGRKLDNKLLRELAEHIDEDWKRLASYLDFSLAHIESFEHNYKDNLEEQVYQMLVAWMNLQTDDIEARYRLMEALNETDHSELTAILSGNGKQ